MATPDYWLARCHVMAHAPSARRWEEDADEAVTVAAVLADDEAQVRALLQQQCHEDGLGLLRLEAIETLLQRCRREGLVQGLVELAHTTSPRHPVAYGEMLPLLPEPTPAPDPAPPPPSVNYQETRWPALFAPHQPPLWAVIDGVNCREAMARLGRAEAQSACLYASTDDATRANAPGWCELKPIARYAPGWKACPRTSTGAFCCTPTPPSSNCVATCASSPCSGPPPTTRPRSTSASTTPGWRWI